MRIHTDTLTPSDLYAAARRAGSAVDVTFTVHGSRSRAVAYGVTLTGSSSRRPNGGNRGAVSDAYAATWDEWGMFLGELFRRDPNAVVPSVYESGEHYRWSTDGRFDALTPDRQHERAGHRWEHEGTVATGTYHVSTCKCGARMRRVAWGHTWDEVHGTLSPSDGY